MRTLFDQDRIVAEGAAAVGHAAIASGKIRVNGPTAILLTGRNVNTKQFADVISGKAIRLDDELVSGD
jgi:threonine dehydratase